MSPLQADDDELQIATEKHNTKSCLLFGRYEVSQGPLRRTESEIRVRALDTQTKDSPVVLQFLSDLDKFSAELRARAGPAADASYILPISAAFCDAGTASSLSGATGMMKVEARLDVADAVRSLLHKWDNNESDVIYFNYDMSQFYPCLLVLEGYGSSLEDHLDRYYNLPLLAARSSGYNHLALARSVAQDVVLGLMELHTEGRVHCDLSPSTIFSSSMSYSTERKTKWKVGQLGSFTEEGHPFAEVKKQCCNWGYLPPEAAQSILSGEESNDLGEDFTVTTTIDAAWDLWSLGCVLYRLVFGCDLWKSSRDGSISSDDLASLAEWGSLDIWRRASVIFPSDCDGTDELDAAIDLVAKLLSPKSEDRLRNFELGIITVHQHEFIENRPLEPPALLAFQQHQNLVTSEIFNHATFVKLTNGLNLEGKWELKRAMDVLLIGAFEPLGVHIPTSFVILKRPLSAYTTGARQERAESCLEEGMKWLSLLDAVGPLVRSTLLEGNVRSIGQFWSKIEQMFEGSYSYFYFVDDLTGEPIAEEGVIGHGGPYPIPIKTRSDVLPKLLPLMILTMRCMALYAGAAGVARMFGAGSNPDLSQASRVAAQQKINNLKDEHGDIAEKPFGSFVEDIESATLHRESFLSRNEENVRCKSLKELIRFFEKKGLMACETKKGASEGDFAGLHRLVDNRGRVIWTLLKTAESVRSVISERATERLVEGQNLWEDDKRTIHIVELEEKIEEAGKDVQVANKKAEKESKRAGEAENRIAQLEEELAQAQKELDQANEELREMEQSGERAMDVVKELSDRMFLFG